MAQQRQYEENDDPGPGQLLRSGRLTPGMPPEGDQSCVEELEDDEQPLVEVRPVVGYPGTHRHGLAGHAVSYQPLHGCPDLGMQSNIMMTTTSPETK